MDYLRHYLFLKNNSIALGSLVRIQIYTPNLRINSLLNTSCSSFLQAEKLRRYTVLENIFPRNAIQKERTNQLYGAELVLRRKAVYLLGKKFAALH